jgi:hypothetical protein
MPSCPQGWNDGSFNLDIEVDPNNPFDLCYGTIYYCWRDVNGQREIIVRGIIFADKFCLQNHDLSASWFWAKIDFYVVEHQATLDSQNPEYLYLLPCDPYNPSYVTLVSISRKTCWKWANIANDACLLAGCEEYEYYCQKSYAYCWDYNYNPPRLVQTLQSSTGSPVNCYEYVTYDPYQVNQSDSWANCE